METKMPVGLTLTDRERAVLDMSVRLKTTDPTTIAQRIAWRRQSVKKILDRLRSFGLIAGNEP